MKHAVEGSGRRRVQAMYVRLLLVWMFLLTRFGCASVIREYDEQRRLLYNLFERTGYNPLIRPVKHYNDTITLSFGINIRQLISVDEKIQVMKTNVWYQMKWHDFRLIWDPSEYSGITSIRAAYSDVWTPDIVLFNNADGNYEPSFKSNAVIYSGGEVNWIPPAIFKTSCIINVQHFPFDQQECDMNFGSWTFNANELNLTWFNLEYPNMADLTGYRISQVWDIIDIPAKIIVRNDTNPPQTRTVFNVIIRRKSLFYTCNLIVPCVLISCLSITVFFLPADAGEKITLSISVLFALVVFLLLVSKILPPSAEEIPLIARYLLMTFVLNTLSVFITVFIINWDYRSPFTHRMPMWVKTIFLYYLPRLLFLKRPGHRSRYLEACARTRRNVFIEEDAEQQKMLNKVSDLKHERLQESTFDSGPQKMKRIYYPDDRNDIPRMNETPGNSEFHGFQKATNSVLFIANHLRDEDKFSTVREDWIFVASVVDRILLYIFFAINLGGTLGTLIQAPHIFEYVNQEENVNRMTFAVK